MNGIGVGRDDICRPRPDLLRSLAFGYSSPYYTFSNFDFSFEATLGVCPTVP